MSKVCRCMWMAALFIPTMLYPRVATCQSEADSILKVMQSVNDWQWRTIRQEGWKTDSRDWTYATMFAGMTALAKLQGWDHYREIMKACEENNWRTGTQRTFADDYCIAQTYVQFYELLGDPRYIEDFRHLADSITNLPHKESLQWENEIYLREWAWCDALFMGPPSFAYLSKATDNDKYLKAAARLWWRTSEFLYDKKEKLFFRDSRYFDQQEKNGTKIFWGRGNGWVLAGLARFMTAMPLDFPDRGKFIHQFREMSVRVAQLQQSDGSWRASLLDPLSYNAKEASGTALFCYALAWGINEGILDKKQYGVAVQKAWDCLVSCVHPGGKLGFVQAQGADPRQVGFDDTDVFGTGVFLLAGSEMFRMALR